MKYIDEYRNKEVILKLADSIQRFSKKEISLMEVCGGHTLSIYRFGIHSLLPKNIKLLSGPGCPVCVTSKKYIDTAIAISRVKDVIITTYGDLIRVLGSTSSLDKEKAQGADIRMVYSTIEALTIAKENPDKMVVFLGIGFETTAPSSAVAITIAEEQKINNFFVFSSHKIMKPALEALINEGVKINGYICPGHVSTITGSEIYTDFPLKYRVGCVISGFEPADILLSIFMLVKQFESNDPKVEIAYKRAVKPEGNVKAKMLLKEVFTLRDDWWRGIGVLKNSGLGISNKYEKYDAEKIVKIDVPEPKEPKGCICGEILMGLKTPKDCKLFNKVCNPENPIGACMVSVEGACQTFYRYKPIS